MVASAATFFFWASHYLYVPVLPVFAESLGASLSSVGIIVASYAVPQLLFRIPIGVAADRLGSRKCLVVAGLAATTGGAALMGFSENTWTLLTGRTATGVGAASWVALSVLFMSFRRPDETGKAIGTANFITGAALVASTGAGGAVAEIWGLRAAFFGAAVLGGIGLLLAIWMVEPETGRARDPSWAAFRRIVTDPLLLTVAFMSLLTNFSSFAGVFGFIPIYADRIGASSAVLGLITMISLGAGAVASLVAARAAARWGDRAIIRVGAVLASLSMVVVPSVKSVALLAVTLTVNGIGNGALATMFMSLAVRRAVPEQRATAMGVYQGLYAIGMLLGPLASGYLASAVSIAGVFYLIAALMAVPVALAWLIPANVRESA